MNDGVFLNIARGTRLSNYAGLEMIDGATYKYGKDYSYIEIPLSGLLSAATLEKQDKALRNQHLLVQPACKLNIRGNYKILVKTHPKLQEYSNCPTMFLLDVGENEQPNFYATFRRDMDPSELDWAVRLYMLS